MKQHGKIIRITAMFLLLIVTHILVYVAGIYRFYKKDFCKSETGMLPIALATNAEFMAACETIRNSTNTVEVYNAATLFVPPLSKFLQEHPDGIHIAVIINLLGWKEPVMGHNMIYFLKQEDCQVYYMKFTSLRPHHINSVSIGIGEM
ncbi:MAG: hypothetical protein ACOX5G_06040 [Kiritimatiellia bacterium]|jgi:hypothetical protein